MQQPYKTALVLGGANSGKSAVAEALVTTTARPRVYIATAQPFDDEMRAKIARHQTIRGENWRTLEAPQDIAGALGSVSADEIVLIDCLTLWLSNHLLNGSDLAAEEARLVQALAACPAPVVLVSNETGLGIVPENALARRFRAAQGQLNQRIAAQADLVVAVMAGLPLVLKGQMPGDSR